MNSIHSALVTGTRPIRKAPTSDGMAWPLVVQGRRLVLGVGTDQRRTFGDENGVGETPADLPPGRRRRAGQQRRSVAQLMRGEHGLDVLQLVLGHQ